MFDLFLVGIHSFQQLDSSLLFAIIAREAVERKRPGWFADERACMLACLHACMLACLHACVRSIISIYEKLRTKWMDGLTPSL